MRLLVDTGVFSASLSRRRPAATAHLVEILSANQIFLAAATVAELRFACRQIGHPLADRIHANDLGLRPALDTLGQRS